MFDEGSMCRSFFGYLMALRRAFFKMFRDLKKSSTSCHGAPQQVVIYLEVVYLVTALVPSETACLASSPGSKSLTAVCTSRLVMVDFLL